MNRINKKNNTRLRRKKSVRKNLSGTADRPRISVFRSNKYIYVQAIDDVSRVTLVGLSERNVKIDNKLSKVEKANQIGESFGKLMKEKKIDQAVFDRSGYRYHGRVKALADGVRNSGIKF